jgi:hypothetical protein
MAVRHIGGAVAEAALISLVVIHFVDTPVWVLEGQASPEHFFATK